MLGAALLLPGLALAGGSGGSSGSAGSGGSSGSGDDLGDVIGSGGKTGQTAKQEQSDLKNGKADDRVGVASEDTMLPTEEKHRLIKTLQKKTFLKIGRYEATPHLGFVTNDPFINRYLVGAAFDYHVTEIFAIQLNGDFSPDFGTGDWKPITHILVDDNKVSPDISKVIWLANADFEYSPIYGKIAVLGKNIINFDIFGNFGGGVANTHDDLKALQAETDPKALATANQIHPTINFGFGTRVIFSKAFAFRLEGRSMSYVETINSSTLELKNNFMLLLGGSIFFPAMKE